MADARRAAWNQRYRDQVDDLPIPLPFLVDAVSGLPPGKALDLACGIGRHALFLGAYGWRVRALDYSDVAIARIHHENVQAEVIDIEAPDFTIPDPPYDLIVDSFFLHRPLFPLIEAAVRPGGLAIFALHAAGTFAIQSAEVDGYYSHWECLHAKDHQDIPTIERVYRKPA